MSIHDVAREAGVSVATVSRVFNLPDKVTDSTREHVLRVASRLGYVANQSARTLRTQRSQVLGVVLPTLDNPVFAECLEGIANGAAAGGYAIQPLMTHYRLESETLAVRQLLAANVEAMILVVSNPADSPGLRQLIQSGLPYVLAYNRTPDHPCVSVDSEQAVAELIARLNALGHQRIAMVTGKRQASDRAQQRCNGYHSGMQAQGLGYLSLLEVPFIETALDQIRRLLLGDERPTALICSNDLLAIRCLRAAHLAGLAVPRQLTVVGFDGIALGQDLTPVLSTITQDNAAIGRRCAELLVASLQMGRALTPADSLTLAHGFRAGESCAAPAPPP